MEFYEKTLGNYTGAYVTTITNQDGLDSANWTDINSVSVLENLNSQSIFYGVSFNNRHTFKVWTGSAWRYIASKEASVHGGTDGTWYFRDNVDTWSTVGIEDNANSAISKAVESGVMNQMNSTTLESISDADWESSGSFAIDQTTFDLSSTFYSTSDTQNPNLKRIDVSVDATGYAQKNVTDDYTVYQTTGLGDQTLTIVKKSPGTQTVTISSSAAGSSGGTSGINHIFTTAETWNAFENITETGLYQVIVNTENLATGSMRVLADDVLQYTIGLGDDEFSYFDIVASDNIKIESVSEGFTVGENITFDSNFSVVAQETAPQGITFNNDGTKMFVVGSTGDDINEYNLSVAFDSATAVYDSVFSVAAQETAPNDVTFNNDGTKMFIVGTTGDDVNEYNLSTGFDVSTAVYDSNFSVAAQDTAPQSMDFNTDGTKMFIVGNTGDDVNEYHLSTGFDVSTAVYDSRFSVATEEATPTGIAFNPDGTKMFIMGQTGIDMGEYELSTGFDISTANFVFRFSVSAQEATPQGIAFNTDGTKMFVTGNTGDDVNEYHLPRGFEFGPVDYSASFSVAAQDTSPQTMAFNTDGTKMFVVGLTGIDINEYHLSTAFDITTAVYDSIFDFSEDGSPQGIAFNTDGTKMFIIGNTADEINEYNLSTAFDISTAVYDSRFDITAQEDSPSGIAFNTDGTKMFITGLTGDDVNEYHLSTGFDVSTTVYDSNFSVVAQETAPQDIAFNTNGTKMFILGSTGDDVNEYKLSTAFDVSTAVYSSKFSVFAQDTVVQGIAFNNDGTKMFIVGATGDDITEYDVLPESFTGTVEVSVAASSGTSSTSYSNIWTQSGSNAYYDTGNIGIGTTTPDNFTLQVAGHIGPDTDDTYDLGSSTNRFRDLYLGPSSLHIGVDGDEAVISYNTISNEIEFSAPINLTGSITLTNDTDACDVNKEGAMRYNDSTKVMEFCNGTAWGAFSTGGFSSTCPSGFTKIENQGQTLGCMQNIESGTNNWEAATNDCFDAYGGRLPSVTEWYIAMANYVLTDETDDPEWNSNHDASNRYAESGNGSISNTGSSPDTSILAYRCWTSTNSDSNSVTSGGGGIASIQTFDTVGAHTWTKPAGIETIRVQVVGGGGGAGGGDSHYGAGGAGGYSEKIIDVSSLNTISVTVGVAGAAGSTGGAGTAGSTGGTTSFDTHCSATGGQGGSVSANYEGGSGGVGSGGDINVSGGNGIHTTNGGSSYFGGGGTAFSGKLEGQAYGSGGASLGGAGAGAGASGAVIIYEYAGSSESSSLPTCTDGQTLSYNESNSDWECADASAGSGGGNIDLNTKLLVQSDDADGSVKFMDSSISTHTITANGDAHHETDASKFGGSSMYFDGAGDYLNIPDSEDFEVYNNEFTIDFWMRADALPTGLHVLVGKYNYGGYSPWNIMQDGANIILYSSSNNSSHDVANARAIVTGINIDTWHHIAFTRDGDTMKTFLDGVLTDSFIFTGGFFNGSQTLKIGGADGGNYSFGGYLDEVRISKGIARWTSDFTPPTAPYEIQSSSSVAGGQNWKLMHVQDQKTTGTDGGTSSVGIQIRDLNTIIGTNEITDASLNGITGEITLPAGTYNVNITVPLIGTNRARLYFYNITDTENTLIGSNSYDGSGGSIASLSGKFTILDTKTFDVRQYAESATATVGLGRAVNQSPYEVYTDLKIWKIEESSGSSSSSYTPGFLYGFNLSNDSGDTDHDIYVSSGYAKDETDSKDLELTTGLTKQLDASFTEGDDQGGLFTGTIANDTMYHVFLIEKDDGTTDIGFDTDINASNIPSGFTSYRWLGYVLTNGSANIKQFQMSGDLMMWEKASEMTIPTTVSTSWIQRDYSAFVPTLGVKEIMFGGNEAGTANGWTLMCSADGINVMSHVARGGAADADTQEFAWGGAADHSTVIPYKSNYYFKTNGGSFNLLVHAVKLDRGSTSGGSTNSPWTQTGNNIAYTSGNVGIGSNNYGTNADNILTISNSIAPTTSITDGIQLFAVDQSGSHELRVRDEAGNTTTLSPHNFSNIPGGQSEELAWSYYSEKDNKSINVDMTKTVRLIEKLTGQQLIYITDKTTGLEIPNLNLIDISNLPTPEKISEIDTQINNTILQTNTNIQTLEDLQLSIDEQLSNTSEMLNQVQGDIVVNGESILETRVKSNINANLISEIDLRIQAAEEGLGVLDLLGATDLIKIEELLAIDAEKLVFTDELGSLTLDGVLNVKIIIADVVETSFIEVEELALENYGDNAIVGKSVICPTGTNFDVNEDGCVEVENSESDGQTVFVETEVVTGDSYIFLTPYGNDEQSVIVSEVQDGIGFTVKAKNIIENMIKFDWFIVKGVQ